MAQVEESGSSRSANTELNLVPFIDLMSVMITFLLITAVWSQVSMIQIGSSVYGKKTNDQTTEPPPLADIPLRLDVKNEGFRVVIGDKKIIVPKKNDGTYDKEQLVVHFQEIKAKYMSKEDAMITVDDEVQYEYLILGMDALLQGGFPSISISTVGAE